ncbi:MAG TPA: hypothetical protein VGN84_12315 [Solirubrobacterales bacterium]|jgi:hypothetical protein|nr:hypothetical protein [Solirubrobacterales bacterium]
MAELSDAATAERARSLANEAVHMVALQHRRLQSDEPEDKTFIFRRWIDFQFLIVSLRRLRLAALLAARPETNRAAIRSAISEFDEALPDLGKMRNVGEHVDEYAVEKGRDRSVNRLALQTGSFDNVALDWLGGRLDADEALVTAEALHRAIKAVS